MLFPVMLRNMVRKMKGNILVLALAALLVNSAYAGFVTSYNATTHTLSMSCIQPSSRNLSYGGSVNALSCTFILSNVIENNSAGSPILINSTFISASLPSHKSYSCLNGMSSTLLNNVSISCPPPVSYNALLEPSNVVTSNSVTLAPNVTFAYQLNASKVCDIQKSLSPSWDNSLLVANTTGNCNISVNVSKIAPLNKTFKVVAGQNISNSTYEIKLVGLHTLLNVNKTLQLGQCWIYAPDNVSVCSPKNLTESLIVAWYNQNVANDCLNITSTSAVNGSASFSYCSVLKGNKQPDLIDTCTNPELRNYTGFSQCFNQGLLLDNQSAVYWHRLALNYQSNESIQHANSENNYTLYTTATQSSTDSLITAVIVICIFVGIGIYFNVNAKREKDTARPMRR